MNKRKISEILGITVAAAGFAVMLSWIFDIDVVLRIVSGCISMKFITALCFLSTGIIIYFIAGYKHKKNSVVSLFIVYFAALCLLAFMGAFLFGSILDVKTGLSELFIKEKVSAPGNLFIGKPSIATMAAFLFISLAGFHSW